MAKSVPKSKSKAVTHTETLDKVQLEISKKILKVKAYTNICKPLNGSLQSSKTSHLLKLGTFDYQYKSGKEIKTSRATAYMIKGLRGGLRHQVMTNFNNRGIEVCHTSDKETDKQGNSFLPKGFHLQGSCLDKKECMVHSVFGSKRHKSKIRVSAAPIANISHQTYQTRMKVQNVHISTETRVALTFGGKSIQDFGERYFAGEFEFEIDVSKCTKEETGMIIEAVMYMQKLGRGYNAGYGEVEIVSIKLVKEKTIRKSEVSTGGEFMIEEKREEEAIPGEFSDALIAWKNYLNDIP